MNLKPTLLYLGAALIGATCAFLITKLQEKPVSSSPVVVGKVTQLSDKERVNLCKKDNVCKILSEVGFYEARSEGDKGMKAVMFVVLNRVAHPKFPDSVHKVVSQPYQFSYRHDGSMKKGFNDEASYERSLIIAHKVLGKELKDLTNGSTFYHTKSVFPKWRLKFKQEVIIKNHIFYTM